MFVSEFVGNLSVLRVCVVHVLSLRIEEGSTLLCCIWLPSVDDKETAHAKKATVCPSVMYRMSNRPFS